MRALIGIAGVSLLCLAGCQTEPVTTDAGLPAVAEAVEEAGLCIASGPQTPRDISSVTGLNKAMFPLAPPASEMNLCNIHTHQC